jgi:hypothetical protein
MGRAFTIVFLVGVAGVWGLPQNFGQRPPPPKASNGMQGDMESKNPDVKGNMFQFPNPGVDFRFLKSWFRPKSFLTYFLSWYNR